MIKFLVLSAVIFATLALYIPRDPVFHWVAAVIYGTMWIFIPSRATWLKKIKEDSDDVPWMLIVQTLYVACTLAGALESLLTRGRESMGLYNLALAASVIRWGKWRKVVEMYRKNTKDALFPG